MLRREDNVDQQSLNSTDSNDPKLSTGPLIASSTTEESKRRDPSVELGGYDVICGRDKAAFNNIGNRRFRVTVSLHLSRYTASQTRREKTMVIRDVADLVKQNGGRFLQNDNVKWVELADKQRNEKIGHALRDMALNAAKAASIQPWRSVNGINVAVAPANNVSDITERIEQIASSQRAEIKKRRSEDGTGSSIDSSQRSKAKERPSVEFNINTSSERKETMKSDEDKMFDEDDPDLYEPISICSDAVSSSRSSFCSSNIPLPSSPMGEEIAQTIQRALQYSEQESTITAAQQQQPPPQDEEEAYIQWLQSQQDQHHQGIG